jgi:hypothetical protein
MIALAEPTTAITDYVLAAVTAALGGVLVARREAQRSRTLWAGAFAALALTALAGGTYHGFGVAALWPATIVLAGVIGFAMLTGSALATTTGTLRRAVVALAALKLVGYLAWTAGRDDFLAVLVDSATALLGVAALHAPRALAGGEPASRAMLVAVALSVAGAGVQASGVTLHRHFNHNDLFHVIQIGATLVFYRGARRLRDRP